MCLCLELYSLTIQTILFAYHVKGCTRSPSKGLYSLAFIPVQVPVAQVNVIYIYLLVCWYATLNQTAFMRVALLMNCKFIGVCNNTAHAEVTRSLMTSWIAEELSSGNPCLSPRDLPSRIEELKCARLKAYEVQKGIKAAEVIPDNHPFVVCC